MTEQKTSFPVDVIDTHKAGPPKIGTTQATQWTDPVSGRQYTVPLGYDPEDTISAFSNGIRDAEKLLDYKTEGPLDLQRGFNGKSFGGTVKDFTPIASFDFGLACAASGLKQDVCKLGGGAVNLKNYADNPAIDTSGEFFNNPKNIPNIEAGYVYHERLASKINSSYEFARIPEIAKIAADLKNSGADLSTGSYSLTFINGTQASYSLPSR